MIEFIINNWADILVVVVFVGVLAFLLFRGKKRIVAKILYALVTEAEKTYGSGTGSVKLAYVMEKAYNALPGVIRAFLTYDSMKELIEHALEDAKIKWSKEAGVEAYLNKGTETA